jgi:hypothetical protein
MIYMTTASWIWFGILCLGAVLFYAYVRWNRFLRCIVFTAATGLGCLGLLRLAAPILHLSLTITPLTLMTSGLLGIPGVVAMLIFGMI